ncbi:MAG TPA: hypothetical protein VFR80_05435 [Pyrinomonadaceae bacterium]|nr:hypothetical protein [Pyrinomonadaceae bacterium]
MKRQNAIVVFLVTLILTLTSFASVPDQPFMQAARADLQKARAALQRAEHNKGGHRANAIGFINSAINEIERGIRYDRTHIRRRHHAGATANENVLRSEVLVVDQPNMRSAYEHLQNAQRNLQSATADKGGHRQNAIDLVKRAIDEVNRGIAAAN